MICTSPDASTDQVDTDVDERAQVGEEGNDRLPLESETDSLDQAAGRLPLYLSPGKHGTNQSTMVRNANKSAVETLSHQ